MEGLVLIRFLKRAFFVFCFSVVFVPVVHAGIAGSKHDFSMKGWGTDEICKFCHTPHNANRTVTDSPLWNHQVTTATYTLYTSPTLQKYPGDPPAQQPLGPSKLCLSCHDGQVAIDSYGGRTGTNFISGLANLGTNLSNDHPVSIHWNHQTVDNGLCFNCHFGNGGMYSSALPFYGIRPDQTVECGTCHEPHNRFPAYTKMLRKSLNKSELCLYCHEK